jgi:hypothetical protein
LLILPGATAHFRFRLQRLHANLGGDADGIRGLASDYVDARGGLGPAQRAVVAAALHDRMVETDLLVHPT